MPDTINNPHLPDGRGKCKSMRWFLTIGTGTLTKTQADRLRKPQLKEACLKVVEMAKPPTTKRILAEHEKCKRCNGTGTYLKGSGMCWRCKGKGFRDAADDERNAKFDRRVL